MQQFSEDEGLNRVLAGLGVDAADLLGAGGEARVYALGADKVVRVLHEGSQPSSILRRDALVVELDRGVSEVALPHVLQTGEIGGRYYAVERRLPGRSVATEMERLNRPDRDLLIENHLEAARALRTLHLDNRGFFGDLLADDPVRAPTWRGYLTERAAKSLRSAPGDFHHLDPARLAEGLPNTGAAAFVHLDAFTGNMLAHGTVITAVIDIGATSIAGDPRLDPLSAAVYLCAPQITPTANQHDRDVALHWLHRRGLSRWFEPARHWLAAYWSWAVDDEPLQAWCRSVLL